MTIKTISTVDGINVVDFGNTINKYYWFKNIGSSTIYVSNKEDFKSGDDGVSELTAKGDVTNIEASDGKVYILGTGKVEIHNTDSKLPPFKSAPIASSGGGEVVNSFGLGYSEIALGFLNGGGKYNGSFDWEKDRLAITKDYADHAIMHSYAVDFTNVKKIVIGGAVTSNLVGLTASGYCKISAEIETKLNADKWIKLATAVPETAYDLLNFTAEIDCTAITGENYINLAIWHGTESNSYTVYLYVDRVEFIYG